MVGVLVRPVPQRAALELVGRQTPSRRTIVVADLHLGFEGVDAPSLRRSESQARAMVEELLAIGRSRRARGFIVAGDVKHPIVGVPRGLRPILFDFFSTLLRERFSVDVVSGNHDVGLAPFLPKEVQVAASSGIVRAGVGIFHGHSWPGRNVLGAESLVVGHLHPGFRFAPTADHANPKVRCWVRVAYPDRERPHPGDPPERPVPRFRARELVVLPAFHPACGVEALNKAAPARGRSFLFRRFLGPGSARAYLLDGTDLGPLARVT